MVHSRLMRLSTMVLPLAMIAAALALVAGDPAPADASVPGTNGKIVYARSNGVDSDLWTMNPDGTGQALLYAGSVSNEWQPVWSPDGTKIAFTSGMSTAATPGDNVNIWVMNADGSNPQQLTFETKDGPSPTGKENFRPQWSPDGQWILFDQLDDFELSGTTATGSTAQTLIAQPGETFVTKGVVPGMKITVTGVPLATTVATVVNETTLTVNAGVLAPGLAYTIEQDEYSIMVMEDNGSNVTNLSDSIRAALPVVYSDLQPSWSPKGDQIAFSSWRNGSPASPSNDVYVANINLSNPTAGLTGLTNLTPDPAWPLASEAPTWSPDGTKIVFRSQASDTPGTVGFDNLWTMDATGASAGAPLSGDQLTDNAAVDGSPAWSPDGTTIAFHRHTTPPPIPGAEGGEIYVVPAAGGSATNITNTGGAVYESAPSWLRSMVATNDSYPVTTGGTLTKDAAAGVMANDVGLGGNPLATASVVAAPTHSAAFSLNGDGSFTYQHDGTDNDDSFTYKVTDAAGNVSNTATVTIDAPSNDAPVAKPDMYNVDAGGTLVVPAPGVLGNDTDTEDGVPAKAVLKTAPAHAVGTFVLNADGSFTYVHDGSAGATDTFTYQAQDSLGKPSNVAEVTIAIKGAPKHSVGLVDPGSGRWYLYDSAGVLKASFYYGNPGDYPIYGDWNGDGVETPGLYRQSDGYVYLRNSNTQGIADIKFFFGNPGDVPIAGDFNGDGFDTVSIYRPSNQTFYIINKLGSGDQGLGAADFSYVFGNPGDKPFVGDFNGNGIETAGLHRESTGLVYFRNTHTQGNADAQFIFGDPGDRLVAGDWTGDGTFTPALFRPSNTTMYFRYTNTQGNADNQWVGGQAPWLPVSGNNGLG